MKQQHDVKFKATICRLGDKKDKISAGWRFQDSLWHRLVVDLDDVDDNSDFAQSEDDIDFHEQV